MGEDDRTSWDDLKNERNLREHAIDFVDLDAVFDGRLALVREDQCRDYGEPRFNMLVECADVVLNVTFTPRNSKMRIISARIAKRREGELYRAKRQSL